MRAGYSVSGRHPLTLFRLCIGMFPEDGLLHVYGLGEDEVTAFTHSASTASIRSLTTKEPQEKHPN